MVREIPLTKGYVTLVDDEDYEQVSQYRWYALPRACTIYAIRADYSGGRFRSIRLHRFLLGVEDPAIYVDHINGDGLDNRRVNLRLASPAENQHNRRQRRDNTSGLIGVHWHRVSRAWHARVRVGGRQRHLGSFDDIIDAGLQRDAAARRFHGEFASLNFAYPGERGLYRIADVDLFRELRRDVDPSSPFDVPEEFRIPDTDSPAY